MNEWNKIEFETPFHSFIIKTKSNLCLFCYDLTERFNKIQDGSKVVLTGGNFQAFD